MIRLQQKLLWLIRKGKGELIKTFKKKALTLILLVFMLGLAGGLQTTAAETVNVVTSEKKITGGKWVKTSGGKQYRYSGGTYAKNTWLSINGKIYHFDSNGICETGWITYKSNSYYAASSGQLYVKKWLTEDENRYYFQANGVCAKLKWVTVGQKTYFFLKSGKQAKNQIFSYKGKNYYVNKNGQKVKNVWIRKNGKMYYFDKDGVRVQKKWVKYKGEYCYLGADGTIVKDSWVGSYYVDQNGRRLKNCVKDGYYLNETGKRVIKVFNGDYIFVGDSRMVGMKAAKSSSNVKYIAKVSQGYDWLNKTAGVTLGYYLKTNPNVKVVLALGVNDLGNIKSYISYYRKLIKKYPKTEFYMLSVNPVEENVSPYGTRGYVKNSSIKAFNKQLKSAFSSRYIDSYNYMWKKENGYKTTDGLHYTAKVYQDLYNFITNKLQ